ncbi:hypothetical protein [Evansella tamaricis]|uniref:Uncharacterized protein n=1 Tax=Evansella tamaricis TaxID=2069301 RepID=A0ABS6JF81_9BACI|nr:hypothetical protein [Evansella tamaricis]MBU9712319.1 hypothetical protein [Evansella tamaricis]
MDIKINVKSISINQVSGSSGVFSGRNTHIGWKSSSKQNEGFGKVEGQDNLAENNMSITFDPDYIDVYRPPQKKDYKE